MRERAEAAPDSPWVADVREDGRAWVDIPDALGHGPAMHGYPAMSRHVASWHPEVAKAVADWLLQSAQAIDAYAAISQTPIVAPHAIAVARAYLGEES